MSALADLQLDLDPGLIEALRQIAEMEYTIECLEAQRRQEQAARELAEARCVNGLGQVRRQIDSFAMHDWWFREGGQVHLDPLWNRYMDRVAPETKVKPVRSKPGIGYGPAAPALQTPFQGAKRFVKVYPAHAQEGTMREPRNTRNTRKKQRREAASPFSRISRISRLSPPSPC